MSADVTVTVQFDCGHRNQIGRGEYGDGSAWCLSCKEFQVYARCLTCHELDCQALDGPTLPHSTAVYAPVGESE